MLFKFLIYLQPTHYFSLIRDQSGSAFPKIEGLPQDVLHYLEKDSHYTSKSASNYDLSWQAIQKGYIGDAPTYTTFENFL